MTSGLHQKAFVDISDNIMSVKYTRSNSFN